MGGWLNELVREIEWVCWFDQFSCTLQHTSMQAHGIILLLECILDIGM